MRAPGEAHVFFRGRPVLRLRRRIRTRQQAWRLLLESATRPRDVRPAHRRDAVGHRRQRLDADRRLRRTRPRRLRQRCARPARRAERHPGTAVEDDHRGRTRAVDPWSGTSMRAAEGVLRVAHALERRHSLRGSRSLLGFHLQVRGGGRRTANGRREMTSSPPSTSGGLCPAPCPSPDRRRPARGRARTNARAEVPDDVELSCAARGTPAGRAGTASAVLPWSVVGPTDAASAVKALIDTARSVSTENGWQAVDVLPGMPWPPKK